MSNKQRHKFNTELIECMAGYLNFRIEYFNNGYMLRLFGNNGKILDYYPTNSKATFKGTNQFFIIPDVEKYLEQTFK